MKYFKNANGDLFADPIKLDGLTEVTSPIREDGTLLPEHEGIADLPKDDDGNICKYYTQEGLPLLAKAISEELKAKQVEAKIRINERKEVTLAGGFPFLGKIIQADDKSRSNFTEYIVKKDMIPYPVNWRTADNTYLQLESAEVVDVMSNAMMQFFGTEVETSFAIIDLVNEAITVEEVDAIMADYMGE